MRSFVVFGSSEKPAAVKPYNYDDFILDIIKGRDYSELRHLCDKYPRFSDVDQFSRVYPHLNNPGQDGALLVLAFMLRYTHENRDSTQPSTEHKYAQFQHLAYMYDKMENKEKSDGWKLIAPYIAGMDSASHQQYVCDALKNSYSGQLFYDVVVQMCFLREGGRDVPIDPVIGLNAFAYAVKKKDYSEKYLRDLYTLLNLPANTRDGEGNNIVHALKPLNHSYSRIDFILDIVRSAIAAGFQDGPNMYGVTGVEALMRRAEMNVASNMYHTFPHLFPSLLPEYHEREKHPFFQEAARLDLLGLSSAADAFRTRIVSWKPLSIQDEERIHGLIVSGADIRELFDAIARSQEKSSYIIHENRLLYSALNAPDVALRSAYVLTILQHDSTAREDFLKRIYREPQTVSKYQLGEEVRDYLQQYLASKGVEQTQWLDQGFSSIEPQLRLDF